jgi:hypothetical protein
MFHFRGNGKISKEMLGHIMTSQALRGIRFHFLALCWQAVQWTSDETWLAFKTESRLNL